MLGGVVGIPKVTLVAAAAQPGDHGSTYGGNLLACRAALVFLEALDSPARTSIPDEVKVFVWNRDRGRCVKCDSNQRLEFDHVIPLALGGANTARNLQLLCETCNRSKGAAIA